MDFLKNKNTIITIIVLAVVAFGAYFYLSGQGDATNPDTLLVTRSSTGGVGGDILSSLIQVNSLRLDSSIFAEVNSLNLKDFGQSLPEGVPTGRQNPFQPIDFGKGSSTVLPGGSSQNIATSTATSTRTIKGVSTN